MPFDYPQCKKCGRHKERIKILKADPKTKKKWYVLTCPECGHESDIEEYKREYKSSSNHSSETNKYPPSSKGVDESFWEDDN